MVVPSWNPGEPPIGVLSAFLKASKSLTAMMDHPVG